MQTSRVRQKRPFHLMFFVLFLVGALLGTLKGVAEEQRPNEIARSLPENLWFIDDGDLFHVDDEVAQKIPLQTDALVTLAPDIYRSRLFALSAREAWALNADGEIEAHWPLTSLEKDLTPGTATKANVLARVLPNDGSLWIARDQHLDAYSAFGQSLHSLELDHAILDLEVDATSSKLWLVTSTGLEIRDAIDGTVLRQVELPKDTKRAHLALHVPSENGWLALEVATVEGTSYELWHLDLNADFRADVVIIGRDQQEEEPLEPMLNTIKVDTTGSLLGLRGSQVIRFDGRGDIASEHLPLTEDRPLRHLLARQDGTLWVSDGREIASLDAAGNLREQHIVSASSNIEALAFIETDEELLAPEV